MRRFAQSTNGLKTPDLSLSLVISPACHRRTYLCTVAPGEHSTQDGLQALQIDAVALNDAASSRNLCEPKQITGVLDENVQLERNAPVPRGSKMWGGREDSSEDRPTMHRVGSPVPAHRGRPRHANAGTACLSSHSRGAVVSASEMWRLTVLRRTVSVLTKEQILFKYGQHQN